MDTGGNQESFKRREGMVVCESEHTAWTGYMMLASPLCAELFLASAT